MKKVTKICIDLGVVLLWSIRLKNTIFGNKMNFSSLLTSQRYFVYLSFDGGHMVKAL